MPGNDKKETFRSQKDIQDEIANEKAKELENESKALQQRAQQWRKIAQPIHVSSSFEETSKDEGKITCGCCTQPVVIGNHDSFDSSSPSHLLPNVENNQRQHLNVNQLQSWLNIKKIIISSVIVIALSFIAISPFPSETKKMITNFVENQFAQALDEMLEHKKEVILNELSTLNSPISEPIVAIQITKEDSILQPKGDSNVVILKEKKKTTIPIVVTEDVEDEDVELNKNLIQDLNQKEYSSVRISEVLSDGSEKEYSVSSNTIPIKTCKTNSKKVAIDSLSVLPIVNYEKLKGWGISKLAPSVASFLVNYPLPVINSIYPVMSELLPILLDENPNNIQQLVDVAKLTYTKYVDGWYEKRIKN